MVVERKINSSVMDMKSRLLAAIGLLLCFLFTELEEPDKGHFHHQIQRQESQRMTSIDQQVSASSIQTKSPKQYAT